uniref:Hydrogenase maturation factor HypA n=1 Tax=Anaerolinea thermolimosa TaxID=229919 RepID=A0A7C4KJ63_9CHLR
MHELSVTENILAICEKHAKENGASKVTDIYLTIGQLSSIVDDSVQFYWDIISQDTLCVGARLHFQRVPAKLKCNQCGHEFTLKGELTLCPQCGSVRIDILSGEEFFVESILIEKEEAV